MVGCFSTKALILPEKTIMNPTAMTTAAIIMANWLAMPSAVMIESSENTMSSSRICTMTAPKVVPTPADATTSSPSSFS